MTFIVREIGDGAAGLEAAGSGGAEGDAAAVVVAWSGLAGAEGRGGAGGAGGRAEAVPDPLALGVSPQITVLRSDDSRGTQFTLDPILART
ncbi:hypothetical protein [Maritimibacter sp. HL-12]|uniref:hypothetical protein n=1 Tax=Maritimibacter sp. HL-12 TaxID=1162418 RepID=UPI00111C1CF2|nr:hypothetical protein [Maritimibacter sp. HL-12]